MKTPLMVLAGAIVFLAMRPPLPPTHLVAKQTCAKPDTGAALPVPDANAGHVLALSRSKCTWTEGALAGDKLADETDYGYSDVIGNASHDRGYGIGSVASGDKYYVSFDAVTTLSGGNPVSIGHCSWSFTGGTGKLAGLSGKGTCTATVSADGTASFEITGNYSLGAPTKAPSKH